MTKGIALHIIKSSSFYLIADVHTHKWGKHLSYN